MDRDIQLNCVVVSSRHYGELHRSVGLFSPDKGLIQAVIYGGRKGKKTSLAPLFSIGTFQLYYNPVKNEYSLSEADYSFLPQEITKDLQLNCTASYFCETSCRIQTDSPEEVFNLLTTALKFLEQNPNKRKKLIIDYTWKLLTISGIATDLTTCPSCDRKLSEKEELGFSTSMITPVCKQCSDNPNIVLLPGSRKYLSYTFDMPIEQALNVELFDTAQTRLSTFLLKWISAFCQWPLKTLQTGLL